MVVRILDVEVLMKGQRESLELGLLEDRNDFGVVTVSIRQRGVTS